MAKEKAAPQAKVGAVIPSVNAGKSDLEEKVAALQDDVAEIEADLVRIAHLLSSGNLDGGKFLEIVTKRQGPVAPGA